MLLHLPPERRLVDFQRRRRPATMAVISSKRLDFPSVTQRVSRKGVDLLLVDFRQLGNI